MKIVQLLDKDADEIGLYEVPDNLSDEEITNIFEKCYDDAEEISDMDPNVDIRDAFETYLELKNITRIFIDLNVLVKGF